MEQNHYYSVSASARYSPQFMNYQLIGGTVAIMLWQADCAQHGENQSTTYEINCCNSYWSTKDLLMHLRCVTNPVPVTARVILSVGYQESRILGSVSDHFLFLYHIKSVIQTLREKGCREIILLNVPPCAAACHRIQHWKILKTLNNTIQKLCEESQDLFLCNIFQLFCSVKDCKRRKEYIINGMPNYIVNMKMYNATSIHNPNNSDLITFSDEGKKIMWQHIKRTIEYRSRVRSIAVINNPLLLLNHIRFTQAVMRERFPSYETQKKINNRKPIMSRPTRGPRPKIDLPKQATSKLIEQVSHKMGEFVSAIESKVNENARKMSTSKADTVPQATVFQSEPSLIVVNYVCTKTSDQKSVIPDETSSATIVPSILTPELDQNLSTNKDLLVENTEANPCLSSEIVPSLPLKNGPPKDSTNSPSDSLVADDKNSYVHVKPLIEPRVQFKKPISNRENYRALPIRKITPSGIDSNTKSMPVKRITPTLTDSITRGMLVKKMIPLPTDSITRSIPNKRITPTPTDLITRGMPVKKMTPPPTDSMRITPPSTDSNPKSMPVKRITPPPTDSITRSIPNKRITPTPTDLITRGMPVKKMTPPPTDSMRITPPSTDSNPKSMPVKRITPPPTDSITRGMPVKRITPLPHDSKTNYKKSKLDSNISTKYFPKPVFQKDLYFGKLASKVDFKHVRAQKTNRTKSISMCSKPGSTNEKITGILKDLGQYKQDTIAYEILKSSLYQNSCKVPYFQVGLTTCQQETDDERLQKCSSQPANLKTGSEDESKKESKNKKNQKGSEKKLRSKKNPAPICDEKIKQKNLRVYDDPTFLSHEFFCGCDLCQKGHRQLLRKLYKFVKMLKKSSE